MSFRIEEKIPLSFSEGTQLLQMLKKSGLKSLYPPREIASIYFDNNRYDLFRDSEEGLLPRKKIRVRNYPHAAIDSFLLETKISSAEGRFKTSLQIDQNIKNFLYLTGKFDSIYGVLQPVAKITYTREYYSFNGFRVTMDNNIKYQDINNPSNLIFDDRSVIEIKASEDTSLDFLISLIHEPRRRFSKYCNSIRFLNLSN